jgi:hypothetical protein
VVVGDGRREGGERNIRTSLKIGIPTTSKSVLLL